MAKKNINEAERMVIKKRYTVGIVVASVFVGLGVLVAGTSVFGFISAFASVVAGLVTIGAGVAIGINAHLRKKNKLEVLNRNQEKQVKKEENLQEKVVEEKQVKKVEEKQKVENELRQDVREAREKNRAEEAGPNTFLVKEEDGKTVCRDAAGKLMIYNINDRNERDIRKIIPSLTGNELRQKARYIISIFDNAGQAKDVQVSANTFERDMNVVYSNIASVRKELGKVNIQQEAQEEVMHL